MRLTQELKLVQLKQKRVNKRTNAFDEAVPAEGRDTAEAKDQAGELSRKQQRIEELMRKLAVEVQERQQG